MITLDLDNLTQENIDEAFESGKACRYSVPCIIGSMMTKEERQYLVDKELDLSNVYALVSHDELKFENNEFERAQSIQSAFDNFSNNPTHNGQRLKELLPHLDFDKHIHKRLKEVLCHD